MDVDDWQQAVPIKLYKTKTSNQYSIQFATHTEQFALVKLLNLLPQINIKVYN